MRFFAILTWLIRKHLANAFGTPSGTKVVGNSLCLGVGVFSGELCPNPQVTTLQTKRRDTDAVVTITITLTNELAPTSPTCIQVYNIIFRK